MKSNSYLRRSQIRAVLTEAMWAEGNTRCPACGLEMWFYQFQGRNRFMRVNRCSLKRVDDRCPSLDHLVPKCQGGPDLYLNSIIICRRCNNRKSNADPETWIKNLNNWRKGKLPEGFADEVVAQIKRVRRHIKKVNQSKKRNEKNDRPNNT